MPNLAIVRKAGNVLSDPVLRRWLLGRIAGRWPGHSGFTSGHPPYLAGHLPLNAEPANAHFGLLPAGTPRQPITLDLAGTLITIQPGEEAALFERQFEDTETMLALHRFAWLPVSHAPEPAWISALWAAWHIRFNAIDDSWAWHPYTAAERAINLLNFARSHGLPENALACLSFHGAAIASRLEYFGDHDTSNHLANNGRGLYILGLELGMPHTAELGLAIIREEARRIFSTSGILREESSHYHLLYTRNYTECWLAALRHTRPEADELKSIAQRAITAAQPLKLTGGLPLIGDVSPDCSPEHLSCLITHTSTGWIATLSIAERDLVLSLIHNAGDMDPQRLARDGWHRGTYGRWTALWHSPPAGWTQMPGHGHQNLGSGEIHYDDIPVLRDPGRGRYGIATDDLKYTTGAFHNTLLVDGEEPYPPNKPYYDQVFRRTVIPQQPRAEVGENGFHLEHHGFTRLRGVGAAVRTWRFEPIQCSIEDRVEGEGRHTIERHLITPHPTRIENGQAIISANGTHFLISDEVVPEIGTISYYMAYNRPQAATRLTFRVTTNLPWSGRIVLRPLQSRLW